MVSRRVPSPRSVDGKVLELQASEAQCSCAARHASLVRAATVCWVLRPDLPWTVLELHSLTAQAQSTLLGACRVSELLLPKPKACMI